MFKRELNLSPSHAFFLFGARQTGKTTLIKSCFPSSRAYNLLLTSEHNRLAANPSLFREEVLGASSAITHIFVDEIQRIPELLNEIQALIDERVPQHFILTGSSARKLKRRQSNLLAGRAWNYKLFPLTMKELGASFALSRALQYGTLPQVYLSTSAEELAANLKSYVEVYLHEEIEAEALSRNLGGFIRFLRVAAQTNGEICNFSNISRDVGIGAVTVKEYFSILEDTLIGTMLFPFNRSERKRHRLSPKFYFFDTGVLRAAQQRVEVPLQPGTFEYGNYFETWVLNEVSRINSYQNKNWVLSFLRTANNVEVDLIIETPRGEIVVVEIKSKPHPLALDFSAGFAALRKLAPEVRCICVCSGDNRRLVDGVEVLPYADFIDLVRAL